MMELKALRESSSILYYANGDCDPIEFAENLSAIEPDLEVQTKFVKKEWWRGEKGAFLVTCYEVRV